MATVILMARNAQQRPRRAQGQHVLCTVALAFPCSKRSILVLALSLNEAHRAAILEDAQDALMVTDADGALLYMTAAAAHLYGFEEREGAQLESLNLQRYALETFELRTLAGDSVPEDEQPLARVLRGEAYQNVELLVRHREKDETRVFVFSGRTVHTDPPIGVLWIRDETDRWKAERRYRTTFEADPAPNLIARLEDEQILQANAGMLEMLGSDKSDIVGTPLSELKLYSRDDGLTTSLDALRAGERIHKRKATLRPSSGGGEPTDVLVSARAIEIDGEPCGLFTFIDVTELERSQRQNVELFARETEARKKAEAGRARLESVLEQAPALMATLEGPEHVFTTANHEYRAFFAGREIVGRRVIDLLPEIEAQGIIGILDDVYRTGESFSSKELPIDLDRHGIGHVERHYFNLVYQPLRDDDDRTIGVLVNAVNITEQVEARKRAESMRAEMEAAYEHTIEGWARALDLRDEDTAGHSQRVTDMTVALARQFGISGDALEGVRRGALLHDIGKMGVPDAILLKPGKLTADEWTVMKGHTVYGRDLLQPIAFLASAIDIPYCHHERWDGTGYPRGLRGEDIPLAARVFAVVDVYDALMSNRPYRDAWPRDQVLEHLREGAGSHFDPSIVEAFLNMPSGQAATATTE
ncbi:MAG: PAS domain-containing protein [Trueperaceae bacterium]|nr:PAS domain-containing protein [Trueperaceae bacterium]